MCEPDRTTQQSTVASYQELLTLLGDSEDEAGHAYQLLRAKLVTYFEGRKITPAEDYADEVFHRIADRITGGEKIEDVNRYAFGIARFVRLESYRAQIHQPIENDDPESRRDDGPIHSALTVEPKIDLLDADSHESLMRECLRLCLADLDLDKRELLLTYYECDESSGRHKQHRKKLAEKLKKSAGALQKQICLLRQKVSSCTKACVQKGNPDAG
jgi:DNA-directed RNA polymerase specialized sigma24 family protein